MTKEEALDVLIYLTNCEDVNTHHKEAMELAIEALEQQTCDDAISRQAVLNTLDKMDKALDTDRTVENYKELLTECYKDLPLIMLKKKTGWHIIDGRVSRKFCCSCGYIEIMDNSMNNWNYCPICGAAKMEEVNK